MKTKNIINPLLLVILIPFVTKSEQKPNILFLFIKLMFLYTCDGGNLLGIAAASAAS